jgi:hypothetical protein
MCEAAWRSVEWKHLYHDWDSEPEYQRIERLSKKNNVGEGTARHLFQPKHHASLASTRGDSDSDKLG